MERMSKYACLWMFLCAVTSLRAETGTFWHVTDFHFDPTVVAGGKGLSCNGEATLSAKYGDYWCDSPWTLVEESVKAMADIKKDVDFIIWTGDSVGHIKDEDTSLENNVQLLQNITDILTETFPKTTVYATLGNHDFFPNNQANIEGDEFYRRVAEMWAPWIQDDNQTDLFKKGGYYSKPISENLILLGLNTNIYYEINWIVAKEGIEDPAGQFTWMAEQLQAARTAGKKVMLTGHVTIGLKAPSLHDNIYPAYRQPLVELLTEYSDVIVASHWGHDHLDNFKIIQNDNGTKGFTHFSAPSVTPWRSTFPTKSGEPAHNPAIRLVEYDKSTGAQLDYSQYFINLTDSNQAGLANWTVLYRFTEAYNVSDMSPESVRTVFKRMAEDGGTLAKQYCQFSLVSRYAQVCTPEMLAEIACAGLINDANQAKKCVQDAISSGVRIAPTAVLASFVLLGRMLR